jgi:hypothetical protein
MNSIRILTLIVLIILIFMVALTANMLRKGDQARFDNICKRGITIPMKKGAIVNSAAIVYPSEDTVFNVSIGC